MLGSSHKKQMNRTLAASTDRDWRGSPEAGLTSCHLHGDLNSAPCFSGVCIIFPVSSRKAIIFPSFPHSWGHHHRSHVPPAGPTANLLCFVFLNYRQRPGCALPRLPLALDSTSATHHRLLLWPFLQDTTWTFKAVPYVWDRLCLSGPNKEWKLQCIFAFHTSR